MQQKKRGVNAARALLPNLRNVSTRISCVVLNKYYEDNVKVFGAFAGFL
jgi:hypothetical protein